MSYMTQFRIVRALLVIGVLAGFGHGFRSLARHHRGHGHCHAQEAPAAAERPAPPSR